ncbi:hypothetical protein EDD85DRAFT_617468 [Armillaria nabsnona]|nr:hypothetical protein EDD85DRAFT_617468 [Armillaria nabsnona]
MQHGSDGAMDAAAHTNFSLRALSWLHIASRMKTRPPFQGYHNTGAATSTRRCLDECRRKLHVLAQSDGGEGFFSGQLAWPKFYVEPRPLQANETQVEKDNIRYAIHVLDDFRWQSAYHRLLRPVFRVVSWSKTGHYAGTRARLADKNVKLGTIGIHR